MKTKRQKRNFTYPDCALSCIFALFLSLVILPLGVDYVLSTKDKVSDYTKQCLVEAGKKYLDNNNENKVTIKELIKSGYIENFENLNIDNCFETISTVTKIESTYYLNLNCINDESTFVFFE
jgi:hypothetical protein